MVQIAEIKKKLKNCPKGNALAVAVQGIDDLLDEASYEFDCAVNLLDSF